MLLATLCAWLTWVAPQSRPAPAGITTRVAPKPATPPALVAPEIAAALPPAPQPAVRKTSAIWRGAALAMQYQSATDLRAFVAEARRRPAAGGGFYAMRALAECRQQTMDVGDATEASAEMAAATHADLHRRGERLDRSARRCAAFVPGELDDDAVAELQSQLTRAGDPLLKAYDDWLQAIESVDYTRMEAALARVFALNDPLLIEWVGITGVDFWSAAYAGAAPMDEAARKLQLDAWRLLPCALGADCQRGDLQTDAACADAGQCAQDRWEAVFRSGGWDTPEAQQALTMEVSRLAQAVRERDARGVLGRPGAP